MDYITVILISSVIFSYVHYTMHKNREDISSYQAFLQIIVGR